MLLMYTRVVCTQRALKPMVFMYTQTYVMTMFELIPNYLPQQPPPTLSFSKALLYAL